MPRELYKNPPAASTAVLAQQTVAVVMTVLALGVAKCDFRPRPAVEATGPPHWNGDIRSSRGVRPDVAGVKGGES